MEKRDRETEKKDRKKSRKIYRALLLGAAAVWLLRHFGRRGGRKYTRSEKHEYYRFLG